MARIRTIKPEFFKNETLADLPALDRLLFIGLWTIADRNGRLEDRPKRIRAEIFPYDENYNVEQGLTNLAQARFIIRYQAAELLCIQIVNFEKHQHPHVKEAASTIPAPCKPGASPVQAPCKPDNSTLPAGHLQVGEHLQVWMGEGADDENAREKIDDVGNAIITELSEQLEKENRHSAAAGPTPARIGIDPAGRAAEIDAWPSDPSMREAFTRGRKIPADLFEAYLADFIAEVAIRTEPHKSATDLRQHFLNYAARRHADTKAHANGASPPRTTRRPNGSPNNFSNAIAGQKHPF
jgi:hypothetical protein